MAKAKDTETAPAAKAAAPSRNTVTVACKLPHGLEICLYELSETEDKKPIMKACSEPVKLAGANAPDAIAGYGLTKVDADFWAAWLKANKRHSAIVGEYVFAHEKSADTIEHSQDNEDLRTGFEGLDPDNPGKGLVRVPKKEIEAAAAVGG